MTKLIHKVQTTAPAQDYAPPAEFEQMKTRVKTVA